MLKRFMGLSAIIMLVGMAAQAHAVGFEIAVGGWQQTFGGTLGYNEVLSSDDILDIDNDFDFDDETKFMGRIKIDLPMAIPNIYLMAAPMQFEGTGSKSVPIEYGDLTIPQDANLDSTITVNQYDVALYWGLPFLEIATANILNVDIGINVRFVDIEAKLRATDTGYDEEDSVSVHAPIPMLYIALQITPVEILAIELEGRGLTIGDNSLYSLIGRLRLNFAGPVFVAGGYRVDKLEIDTDDVDADIDFGGPFLELGLKF